jgi:hypothetical protein
MSGQRASFDMAVDLGNRRLTRILLAVSATIWCAIAASAETEFHRLLANDIRAILIGSTVTDDAHWADRFLPDGVLDSHELGERRRGVWVIENDELCITRKPRRPVKECFEVWLKGDEIEYRRDGVSVMSGFLRDRAQ